MTITKSVFASLLAEKAQLVQDWYMREDLSQDLRGVAEFNFLVKEYLYFFLNASEKPLLSGIRTRIDEVYPCLAWLQDFIKFTKSTYGPPQPFEGFKGFVFVSHPASKSKDEIKMPPITNLKLYVEEAKRQCVNLQHNITHRLQLTPGEDLNLPPSEQAKEMKPFTPLNSRKSDLEFGDRYFVSTKGIVYSKQYDSAVGSIGKSGYYLMHLLKAIGRGQSVGKKDFKPNKKMASFAWTTIKKSKCQINKLCGEVIGTNAQDEFYYAYVNN